MFKVRRGEKQEKHSHRMKKNSGSKFPNYNWEKNVRKVKKKIRETA